MSTRFPHSVESWTTLNLASERERRGSVSRSPRWAREPSALSPLTCWSAQTLGVSLLCYGMSENKRHPADFWWQYWPLSFSAWDVYWVEYLQRCTQSSSSRPGASKQFTLHDSHTVIMVEGLLLRLLLIGSENNLLPLTGSHLGLSSSLKDKGSGVIPITFVLSVSTTGGQEVALASWVVLLCWGAYSWKAEQRFAGSLLSELWARSKSSSAGNIRSWFHEAAHGGSSPWHVCKTWWSEHLVFV